MLGEDQRLSLLETALARNTVRETLQSPEVNAKLTAGGFEVMATDGPGAERHARQEYERWSAFVRTTGLKISE